MIYEMTLHKSPFLAIKSGKKTIEMRLYDEKRKPISVGDQIRFTLRDSENETILTEVVSISVFDSFEKLYAAFPLSVLGYTEEEYATASYLDMGQYYSPEAQAACGVVGIGIRLI